MEKKTYEKPVISREELEQELLDTTERLWLANEKLKREEESRNELFSNISHDLRSPMAALMSSVSYLKQENLTASERQKVLELMERRIQSMHHLLDDMFWLTKLDTPSLELKKEEVDLRFFLEDFFFCCEADAKYAMRNLKLDLDNTLSVKMQMDPQLFTRVLDNLFSNALKYSERDAQITLHAASKEGEILISVEDTGFGISEENLPHIFERTFRASKARTPGDDSSGLGLAIAKSIVEKHGGTISCTSREGVGSCFTMTFYQF